MSARSRLRTALEEGALSLSPDLCLWRPPAGFDLPVDPSGVRVVATFRPDADAWKARGADVAGEGRPAGTHLVVLGRSKALNRDMVAEAAALSGGRVLVDGQKTDGADSLFREVRKRLTGVESLTKAHGRLFWFDAPADLADWRAPGPTPGPEGFVTRPGIFSEGGVDKGSALLAANLPEKLGKRVADLGAGWGYLSAQVLASGDVDHVALVEAEALALDCARQNVTDPRAAFHWTDARDFATEEPFDAVVCNPPFHEGRKGAPELGLAFIGTAARILKGHGSLWLVANRHLPYEAALKERFARVTEIGGNASFKLFQATRPRR